MIVLCGWLHWLLVTLSILPGFPNSTHAEHYCSGQWPKPQESLMVGSTMRQSARTSGTAGTLGEEGFQGRRATNKQIAVDSRSALLFWYFHPLDDFSAISQLCMIGVRANALQALQPAGLYGLHFQSLWEKPSGWTICVSPGFSFPVQPLAITCSQCRISRYACHHGRSWEQSGIITFFMFLLRLLYTNEPSKFWTWSWPSKLWHMPRPWPELHWASSSAGGERCGKSVFPYHRNIKRYMKHHETLRVYMIYIWFIWVLCLMIFICSADSHLRPESQIRHFIDSADVRETRRPNPSDVRCFMWRC